MVSENTHVFIIERSGVRMATWFRIPLVVLLCLGVLFFDGCTQDNQFDGDAHYSIGFPLPYASYGSNGEHGFYTLQFVIDIVVAVALAVALLFVRIPRYLFKAFLAVLGVWMVLTLLHIAMIASLNSSDSEVALKIVANVFFVYLFFLAIRLITVPVGLIIFPLALFIIALSPGGLSVSPVYSRMSLVGAYVIVAGVLFLIDRHKNASPKSEGPTAG